MLKSGTTYECLIPYCSCNVRVIKVQYQHKDYIKAKIQLVTKASGAPVEVAKTYKIPRSSLEYWKPLGRVCDKPTPRKMTK